MIRRIALAAACTAAVATPMLPAKAQTAQFPCRGKISMDQIYSHAVGAGQYDYFVRLHNVTKNLTQWTLTLSGFPTTVTVFSPVLTGGSLKGGASEAVRFGKGTNATIGIHSVQRVYDAVGGSGRPAAALTECITAAF
jgi:hypothetical protein